LASRLRYHNITTREQTLRLVAKHTNLAESGAPTSLPTSAREREPNWPVGELFRLISIIADAKYATDVHYMHNKADNRSTIDRGRQDPFSSAFMHAFNDVDYASEPPDACV
jgi:hypothetical protein